MTAIDDTGLETRAEAVDAALAAVAELAEPDRAAAHALKDAIEAFHREGLVRLVQAMKADPAAREVLFDLVDDPTVRALFTLHGILRPDPVTAANQALDTVRPYLQSHGGDVELVSVEEGVATVRLSGACNGCSMSAVTLQDGVREALVGQVPGITEIAVADEPTTAFIPLSSVKRKPSDQGDSATTLADQAGWEPGPAVSELSADKLTRVDFGQGKQAQSFVVSFIDKKVAVFRNECVHQGKPIDEACFEEGAVVCPWHGFRFDPTSGECLSAPAAQLVPIPARLEDGRVWIRVGS